MKTFVSIQGEVNFGKKLNYILKKNNGNYKN